MRSLLLVLHLLSVGTETTEASDPMLPFMDYLDQDHLVCLKWGFDALQENITFKLVVNTTGWVGFGFSPSGGMGGSDIVIGGLGPSGSYFKDYHATGNAMPSVDEEQSYTLLSLTESDGQTIMTFERSILSCDDKDFHITATPIKLIYAYGKTDKISYHQAHRGTKEVNLLNHTPRTTFPKLNYLRATMDNITIPSNQTYYHCKIMKFPTLKTKRHVYLVEPVIENPDMVREVVLYHCPSFVMQEYDRPCYMGDIGDACFGVVAAVGGEAFELPENVGIPVGGEDSDPYYRLEIHYDNPNKETGRTDSSGMKLYYTSKLQKHEVGILVTGMLPFDDMEYNIPPKATQFHSYSTCNTSVFPQLANPVPDLHVFAVLLHAQLAARKFRVGHYRNGRQMGFLAVDEKYDSEKQQLVHLGKIQTIKQGDEIAVECTYSTADRAGVTKMGLASTDEMCLALLLYYPAIKITSCLSHPNTTHPLMNTSYQMFEGNATSDQNKIAEYEHLLKTVPQIQVVSDDNFHFSFYENGTIKEMMKTPTVTCQNSSASSRLSTSWIVNQAGILFLLLWITLM